MLFGIWKKGEFFIICLYCSFSASSGFERKKDFPEGRDDLGVLEEKGLERGSLNEDDSFGNVEERG